MPDDSYQKEIYKKYRKYYKKYEAATATKEEREAKAEQIKQIEEVLDIISLSVSKFEIAVQEEVNKWQAIKEESEKNDVEEIKRAAYEQGWLDGERIGRNAGFKEGRDAGIKEANEENQKVEEEPVKEEPIHHHTHDTRAHEPVFSEKQPEKVVED